MSLEGKILFLKKENTNDPTPYITNKFITGEKVKGQNLLLPFKRFSVIFNNVSFNSDVSKVTMMILHISFRLDTPYSQIFPDWLLILQKFCTQSTVNCKLLLVES